MTMTQIDTDGITQFTGRIVGDVRCYSDNRPKIVFTLDWLGIKLYVEAAYPNTESTFRPTAGQIVVVIGKIFPRHGKLALRASQVLPKV